MDVRQTTLKIANSYVEQHHRHHGRVIGHKWSLAAYKDGRLCTDGTRNACSCLYAAAARRAKKEGYSNIITFILQSEPGISLRAAGWTMEAAKAGRPRWNTERYANRPIQLTLFPQKQPPEEYKQRWSKQLQAPEEVGHV